MEKVTFTKIKTEEEFDSYDDWGLILNNYTIEPSSPNINIVEPMGSTTPIDLSEVVMGRPTYKTRKITMEFTLLPSELSNWLAIRNAMMTAIHGHKCNIAFSGEEDYYYVGRVSIVSHTSDNLLKKISVEAICNPYKVAVESTIYTSNLRNNGWQVGEDFDSVCANISLNINVPTTVTISSGGNAIYYKLEGDTTQKTLQPNSSIEFNVENPTGEYIVRACRPSSVATSNITIEYIGGIL